MPWKSVGESISRRWWSTLGECCCHVKERIEMSLLLLATSMPFLEGQIL